MRRRLLVPALAPLLCALALAAAPRPAGAAGLAFLPCASGNGFGCASLIVPLARSGAAPGTISLSVERRLAGAAPSRSAVVALAGGPGQAALPLGEFIAQAIAPALGRRDLVVFDQRGTGASDPLACGAIERFSSGSIAHAFEQCALQIGPARGAFTTQETVQDIEALREAGGYEKLVLYGTSYGTKVALEYAAAYPQYVEALVLDSVVPASGPEPLAIPTFEAIGGVLDELCATSSCAGITANPLGDVARLAAQLRRHALGGSVYDGSGHRHASSLSELGLLQILEAGDLNPALRALLPAAVQSARRHDPDPLLRLHLLSEGLIPTVPKEAPPPETGQVIDEALFVTTTCEEAPFQWQRSAPAARRLAEALASLHAQAPSDFYPFDGSTAYANSLLAACAGWPDASSPPPSVTQLPDLPTLIFSGAQDLRTPTSNARLVASMIPDAQLEVVPYTGHSVIGSDLSECSSQALANFFAARAVQPCSAGSNPFAPTPLTPTRLTAVHPPSALRGRPGQTLVAVLDTLVDLDRQVIGATLQADAELPSGSRFGGLRGGFAKLTATAAVLRDFSFVPGVKLTGSVPVQSGRLQLATIRVAGTEAASGTVTFGSSATRVSGTLGGRHFDLALAKVKLASAGARQWPSLKEIAPLLGRGR